MDSPIFSSPFLSSTCLAWLGHLKSIVGRTRVFVLIGVNYSGREALRGPHQFTSKGKPLDRPPPESIAILLSQSGFSEKAMVRAWRSPSPMMLVHLPGGRPSSSSTSTSTSSLDSDANEGTAGMDGEIMVEGAWWNPSLGGPRGLLGGHLELRREILDSSGANPVTGEVEVKAQYRVWYDGKRMLRFGPPLKEEAG